MSDSQVFNILYFSIPRVAEADVAGPKKELYAAIERNETEAQNQVDQICAKVTQLYGDGMTEQEYMEHPIKKQCASSITTSLLNSLKTGNIWTRSTSKRQSRESWRPPTSLISSGYS